MENLTNVSVKEIKALLREGAKKGDKQKIEAALNAGANLNLNLNEAYTFELLGKHLWNIDSLGYRAIHWAARFGHTDLIQYLIANGANINQVNDVGNTALHVAIYYNQYQTAELLLSLGANVNCKNQDSALYQVYAETPLHYAVQYSSKDMIALLCRYQADNSHNDSKGRTPIKLAVDLGLEHLLPLLVNNVAIDSLALTNPQSASLDSTPNQLLAKAKTYLRQRAYKEALDCYLQVLKQSPTDIQALIGKGNVMRLQQNPKSAMACYNRALKLEPNNIEALFNKAMVFTEMQDYFAAIDILKGIINEQGVTLHLENYNDLAHYMQKHYMYIPPILDFDNLALLLSTGSQPSLMLSNLKNKVTIDEVMKDQKDATNNIPLSPPPPPPPPTISNLNRPLLKKAASQPTTTNPKPNLTLSFLEDIRKQGEGLKQQLKKVELASEAENKLSKSQSNKNDLNLLTTLLKSDIFKKRQQAMFPDEYEKQHSEEKSQEYEDDFNDAPKSCMQLARK